MTKEKEFLETFNELEQFLNVEYNQDRFSYSGFMSTIYRIKKANKNPLIANKYNFDILQKASQINQNNTNQIYFALSKIPLASVGYKF